MYYFSTEDALGLHVSPCYFYFKQCSNNLKKPNVKLRLVLLYLLHAIAKQPFSLFIDEIADTGGSAPLC